MPTPRQDAARKAGSVKSEKKRAESAKNLQEARAVKKVIVELGRDAYKKVVELGEAEYLKGKK